MDHDQLLVMRHKIQVHTTLVNSADHVKAGRSN
jgi:hypothetical protein